MSETSKFLSAMTEGVSACDQQRVDGGKALRFPAQWLDREQGRQDWPQAHPPCPFRSGAGSWFRPQDKEDGDHPLNSACSSGLARASICRARSCGARMSAAGKRVSIRSVWLPSLVRISARRWM